MYGCVNEKREVCVFVELRRGVACMCCAAQVRFAEMRSCFDSAALYRHGRWLPQSGPLPYRLSASELPLWDPSSYHGICEESGGLPQYVWSPFHCEISMTDAQSICKKMDGLHILYAGDSVIEQVFISATHALGANFSDAQNNQWQRNYGRYESLVCRGRVRLGYIRSDMLFWYASRQDSREVNGFRFFPALYDFREAAVAADVVVLGGGHHFSNRQKPFLGPVDSIWSLGKLGTLGLGLNWSTVFRENLNHTMSRLIATRAAAGKASSSLILLSPIRPTGNCWEHREPIMAYPNGSIARKTSNGTDLPKETGRYMRQYLGFGEHSKSMRALAELHNASFCDVYAISALRPDAAKARFLPEWSYMRTTFKNGTRGMHWHRWGPDTRDCLHTCQPGPVDTWSIFIFNLIREHAGFPQGRPTHTGRFNLSLTYKDLGKRGRGRNRDFTGVSNLPTNEPQLSSMWWWPRMNNNTWKVIRANEERDRQKKAALANLSASAAKPAKRKPAHRRQPVRIVAPAVDSKHVPK